jgi:predicted CXXCH cytochrome family protein
MKNPCRSSGLILLALGLVLLLPRATDALNPNHDCAFCHSLHGGGFIVTGDTNQENLCLGCHGGTTSQLSADVHINRSNTTYAPFKATCLRCHNPHDTDPARSSIVATNWLGGHSDSGNPLTGICNVSKDVCTTIADCQTEDNECILWKEGVNIKLVGGETTAQILTWELDSTRPECAEGSDFTGIPENDCYLDLIRNVVFEQRGKQRKNDPVPDGEHSFADEDVDSNGVFDGPCEVCHTQTTHHRNDGSEPSPGHNNGRRCTDCHGHIDNFNP